MLQAFNRTKFGPNSRNHLLEASQCGFDILSCSDVVLDVIHERGVGNAARVGSGFILAAGLQRCVSTCGIYIR